MGRTTESHEDGRLLRDMMAYAVDLELIVQRFLDYHNGYDAETGIAVSDIIADANKVLKGR